MFKNEPLSDFSVEPVRRQMLEGFKQVMSSIESGSIKASPIIEGKSVETGQKVQRENPSNKSRIIGTVHYAGKEHVEQALDSLSAGAESWRNTPMLERAEKLSKAAQIMRDRRYFLNALISLEAGKPWKEADGDVAEAIDFCDYYAQEAVNYAEPIPTSNVPGEENFYLYQPRGIAVVIAPWNFPLAIACGMVTAALVTGNTTILKPAEQTSLIACELAKILFEAGIPADAFAFLPGIGEEIGKQLVEDPRTDMICFTGSKNVGLQIIKSAAAVVPGQESIKKVVAELGGKNSIIIDEDADIDDAIKGVIQSAFGFSGQKCSACSRLIVVGDLYDRFVERLADASRDIIIGAADQPATLIGPVIDEEARSRIQGAIDKALQLSAGSGMQCILQREVPSAGYYISPVIFKDVPETSFLWTEEIFGPVLACRKAKNFEEAVKLANNSQYALTGGVFSRNPKNLEYAKINFKVGNLYLNRSCTGALVGRQPFGGFKMSGIGSKAGGKDYLLQFMEPRTITENTMRRGFV